MKLLPLIVLGLITTLLTACGGGGGGGGGNGNSCGAIGAQSRVFNGDTCNQSARTPVIALIPVLSNGNQFLPAGICTASLVTIDDFVTSAHCFATPLSTFGSNIAGFVVTIGGAEGEYIGVSNFRIHPLYDGTTGSPFDVAMGTLSRPPTPLVGPLPVLTSIITEVGDAVTTFGYGTSNQGEIGTLKAADLVIDAFENGNIVVDTEGGSSICQGDSGGPLIEVKNGTATLVGINSFVFATPEQCGATGSRLSGFVDVQTNAVLSFILGYVPDVATY